MAGKTYFTFVVNCLVLIQMNEAYINLVGLPSPSVLTTMPDFQPVAPPTTLQPMERTPKCYPETAKAYFLPAPPSAPKVTVLDVQEMPLTIREMPRSKEKVTVLANEKDFFFDDFDLQSKEASSILPTPTSCFFKNRPNLLAPRDSTVLPDLLKDIIPSLKYDKSNCQLAESKKKVCDTCADLLKNSPMFKFDKDLFKGFLSGLEL